MDPTFSYPSYSTLPPYNDSFSSLPAEDFSFTPYSNGDVWYNDDLSEPVGRQHQHGPNIEDTGHDTSTPTTDGSYAMEPSNVNFYRLAVDQDRGEAFHHIDNRVLSNSFEYSEADFPVPVEGPLTFIGAADSIEYGMGMVPDSGEAVCGILGRVASPEPFERNGRVDQYRREHGEDSDAPTRPNKPRRSTRSRRSPADTIQSNHADQGSDPELHALERRRTGKPKDRKWKLNDGVTFIECGKCTGAGRRTLSAEDTLKGNQRVTQGLKLPFHGKHHPSESGSTANATSSPMPRSKNIGFPATGRDSIHWQRDTPVLSQLLDLGWSQPASEPDADSEEPRYASRTRVDQQPCPDKSHKGEDLPRPERLNSLWETQEAERSIKVAVREDQEIKDKQTGKRKLELKEARKVVAGDFMMSLEASKGAAEVEPAQRKSDSGFAENHENGILMNNYDVDPNIKTTLKQSETDSIRPWPRSSAQSPEVLPQPPEVQNQASSSTDSSYASVPRGLPVRTIGFQDERLERPSNADIMDSPSQEKHAVSTPGDGDSPGSLFDSSVDSDMLSIPEGEDLETDVIALNFGLDLEAVINSAASDLLESYLLGIRSVASMRLTSIAEGIRTHGSGSSNAGVSSEPLSGGQGTSISSGQRALQPSLSDNKRSRDDDEQEFRPPSKKATADTKIDQSPSRLFACPFWKHEPRQHRTCFRVELTKISYVKQHLSRAHYRETYCERCLHVSPDKASHQAHLQQQCEYRPPDLLEGISHDQHRALSRKSNKTHTDWEKWFVIWDIVLPGKPRPTTPYMDPGLSQDIHEFRNYLQVHAPGTLRRELQAAGISLQSEQIAEDTVFQVATNRALEMMFDNCFGELNTESADIVPGRYLALGGSLADSGIELGNREPPMAAQVASSIPEVPDVPVVAPAVDDMENDLGPIAPQADANLDDLDFDWDGFDWDSYAQQGTANMDWLDNNDSERVN